MAWAGFPLQLGYGDILSGIFSNQLELEFLLLSLAGYTFLAMTARRTWLWRDASSTERILIGITIGLGFEGLLLFPYSGYLIFATHTLDLESSWNYTSFWSIAFLIIISIVLRSGGITESTYRRVVSAFSKTVGYFVGFLWACATFLWAITWLFYPHSTSPFLIPYIGSAFVFWYIGFLYSFGFWWAYHNIFDRRLPTYLEFRPQKDYGNAGKLARRIRSFDGNRPRKRVLVVSALAAILVIGLTSLDLTQAVFTPSVTISTVNFTSPYAPFPPVGTYWEVMGQGTPLAVNGTKACSVNVYQSLEESIKIHVPLLGSYSERNVTVPNPSSVSVNISPFSPTQPGEQWTYLGIVNPNRTAITEIPRISPVSSFNIGLSNQSSGSEVTVGLIYWKLSTAFQVTCFANLSYSKLPNGTAMVTERFTLTNNGNSTALLKVIHAHDVTFLLNNDPLFANPRTVTFFWGNNSEPFSSQGVDEIAPFVGAIPPGNETTFTVVATGPGIY